MMRDTRCDHDVAVAVRQCSHLRNRDQRTYAEWEGKRLCFDCIKQLPGVDHHSHPLWHVWNLERWKERR